MNNRILIAIGLIIILTGIITGIILIESTTSNDTNDPDMEINIKKNIKIIGY
jgi:hypothetical protein